MQAAIEPFVALNFAMNTVILAMSARVVSVGRLRMLRIFLGAAMGTAYALAAWTFPPLGPVLFVPITLVMAWSVAPVRRAGALIRRAFALLGCAFLCGGTAYAVSQAFQSRTGALLLALPAAALWLRRLVRTKNERLSTQVIRVRCELGTDCAVLDGIVDSGNRLVDAVTGLPVIVADAHALRALLPGTLDPSDVTTLPPGFRLMRLSGVCGAQLTMCFHPRVWLLERGAWREAQAVVALSPRALTEAALVPWSLLS